MHNEDSKKLYISINGYEENGFFTLESLLKKIEQEKLVYYDLRKGVWESEKYDNLREVFTYDNLRTNQYDYKFKAIPEEQSLEITTINKVGFYLLGITAVIFTFFVNSSYSISALTLISGFSIGAVAKKNNRSPLLWGFMAAILPFLLLFIFPNIKARKLCLTKIEVDNRTFEQIKKDDDKFDRQQAILKFVAFTLVIGGIVTASLLMLFNL